MADSSTPSERVRDEKSTRDVLGRYQNVTVIGAGVIGASWTALFLAHGLNVVVNDPRADIETVVKEEIEKIVPTLDALGLPTKDLVRDLRFEADLERAVENADLVQENGPERLRFKQDLWARVSRTVPRKALLLSSSSARTATEQARELEDASRLLIGHPFNPPHLIPLVEVVPGERTDPRAVEDAVLFYKAVGKVPRVLRKEIAGFVANRLQSAIFRECVYLVKQGVVTVDELDDVVTNSIGLRWAAGGPFLSYHLGGGRGGLPAFFKQFGPGLDARWQVQNEVRLDEATTDLIIDQANASFAAVPQEKLESERDQKQLAILRALATVHPRNTMTR
jgi:ketoreductase RED1